MCPHKNTEWRERPREGKADIELWSHKKLQGRCKEGGFLRPSEGAQPFQHFDFGFSLRKYISHCF
jgi:hypothetical protein